MKQPIQPMKEDSNGKKRFVENSIVKALLQHASCHGFDMNWIAKTSFKREDRVQFAQLIGYSRDGFAELHYVNGDDCAAADLMYEFDISSEAAQRRAAEELLASTRTALRLGIAELYGKHPEDLM